MDYGACGLAVAKVGEAEIMVESGCGDILVAYPAWGREKIDRLIPLTEKTGITVALDSAEVARGLSERAAQAGAEIGILVESDVGMKRSGIPAGPDVIELAEMVNGMPGLELRGLMVYPGHIWFGPGHREEDWDDVKKKVAMLIAMFRGANLPLDMVSTGGTPSSRRAHELEGITETRIGSYPFLDMNYVNGAKFSRGDCALSVLATVVSTAVPGRAIIDGGSKTFSGDGSILGADGGYGHCLEDPNIRLIKMNEEHGYLDVSGTSNKLSIGDKLRFIPNHVCATVNMHEVMYGIRGESVETEWKVAARGKIR